MRSLLSQSCPAWGQPGPWGQPGRLVWVELSEQLRWVIPEVSCAPASPGGHRALSTSDGPLGGGHILLGSVRLATPVLWQKHPIT